MSLNLINCGATTVKVAPSPATSGVTMELNAVTMPTRPCLATIFPSTEEPTQANSEIVEITATTGAKVEAMIRAVEGPMTARAIKVGDKVVFSVTAAQLAGIAARAEAFTPTTLKTGAYNAAPGDYIPVDISAGSVAIKLPTKPADKVRIGVKIIAVNATPGATTCTINCGGETDVFNVAAGNKALTLSAKFQSAVLQYQASTSLWYVQATDTPLNEPLGAALLGTNGTIGGAGGSLLDTSILTFAPAASGDETGATDTAALAAAMPARGCLMLRSGDYHVTALPTVGPGQAIQTFGMGLTTVYQHGSDTCFRLYNPSMSTAGGEAEFVKNMPGRCGGFVIDGSKASAGAVGVQVGDINCTELLGVLVRHFTGAGCIGFLFKSEVAWCERNLVLNCLAINNTRNVVWDNASPATGSFDGSHFEIQVIANANQDGFDMRGGVQLYHSFIKGPSGPFFAGEGNTGVVWKIGVDNTKVLLPGTHLVFQAEVDGNSGTGHKTIEIGTQAEVSTQGVLAFNKGGTVGFVSGSLPSVRFSHSGYIKVDSSYGENQIGEGLNVIGGSTWQKGSSSVETGELKVGVNGGDYFAATLTSGANILKLNNVYPGRARSIYLLVTQPGAGEPGTINWNEPGNNKGGNAQSIAWGSAGGAAPILQGANGGVDLIKLVTNDGQHWYGSVEVGGILPLSKPSKPANGAVTIQKNSHPTRSITAAITGDGAKTEFEINHKLESLALAGLTIQTASAENPAKVNNAAVSEIVPLSKETVKIKFSVAPAAGEEFFVTINA